MAGEYPFREGLHFTSGPSPSSYLPYLWSSCVTILMRNLHARHSIATATVTEKAAQVRGLLAGVTMMTLMTVFCGYVLSRGADEQYVQQTAYAFLRG